MSVRVKVAKSDLKLGAAFVGQKTYIKKAAKALNRSYKTVSHWMTHTQTVPRELVEYILANDPVGTCEKQRAWVEEQVKRESQSFIKHTERVTDRLKAAARRTGEITQE